MKNKKILVLLIIASMTLPVFYDVTDEISEKVSAEVLISNEFEYVIENNEAIITAYNGDEETVIIPDEIDGCKVTALDGMAFYNNDNIISVTLNDNVENIGDACFANCSMLQKIEFGNNLKSIGKWAFQNCTILIFEERFILDSEPIQSTVTFPDTLENIDDYAFMGCEYVTEAIIPDNIQYIGQYSLGYHYNEKHIKEKNNKIIIHARKETVGYNYAVDNEIPIMETLDFTYMNIQNGNDEINIISYIGTDIDVVVPSSINNMDVTEIGSGSSTKNIETVYIPEPVKKISGHSFLICKTLKSVHLPETLECIDERAFASDISLEDINIPENCLLIGENAFITTPFIRKYGTGNILFDNGVLYHYNITSNNLVIPDNVKALAGAVFANTEILSVEFPETLQVINDRCFANTLLENVDMPENVDYFGDGVFWGCTALESVNLPKNITYIPSSTFENCSSLKNIEIPDSVEAIGINAFENCSSLKSITIPASVTKIKDCGIGYSNGKYIDGFIMYGYKGSEAEKYALENDIEFVSIGDAPVTLKGDVNDDGEIDIRDITTLNQYTVKMIDLSEQGLKNADITGDDIIDLKDLGQLKKYIIKVIDSFE